MMFNEWYDMPPYQVPVEVITGNGGRYIGVFRTTHKVFTIHKAVYREEEGTYLVDVKHPFDVDGDSIQVWRYVEGSMRSPKIEYADGKLRGVSYACNKILEINDRLMELANELYGVSSPEIKSLEEAMYQKGTRCYQSNIVTLMMEEEKLNEEMRKYKDLVNEVGQHLKALNDKEVNILSGYYEFDFTIKELAEKYYVSVAGMWRIINEILSKLEF